MKPIFNKNILSATLHIFKSNRNIQSIILNYPYEYKIYNK